MVFAVIGSHIFVSSIFISPLPKYSIFASNTANPVITPFDVNPKIPGRGMSLIIVILLLRQRRRLGINVETTSVAMYIYTKETTETVQAKPYKALGCL